MDNEEFKEALLNDLYDAQAALSNAIDLLCDGNDFHLVKELNKALLIVQNVESEFITKYPVGV